MTSSGGPAASVRLLIALDHLPHRVPLDYSEGIVVVLAASAPSSKAKLGAPVAGWGTATRR